MQKRIALLYDFDYTLSDGFMQQFGLMQDLGFDDVYEFFKANDSIVEDVDMDKCLSSLGGVLLHAHSQGKKVTKEYLRNFGKDIKYFPGVEGWFDKINEIGRNLGYEIEHYIISSGIKEIIEGTSIAKHFKRIYSNFYAYKDGEAFWPSQVVNYSSKIQFIYRVRKNILDNLSCLKEINEKMPKDKQLPFENIIYFGDSQTDIPSFKVVKNSGGMSICVYSPFEDTSKSVAEKCYNEGRVNVYLEADYREGSKLFTLIKEYIENIARNN